MADTSTHIPDLISGQTCGDRFLEHNAENSCRVDDAETLPEDLEPVELVEVENAPEEMPPEEWGQDGVGYDEDDQEGGES